MHESLPRSGKNIVHAPTEEQYDLMLDRIVHGETAVIDKYPELARDYDFDEYLVGHPELHDLLSIDITDGEELSRYTVNPIREQLAGPKQSVRDFVELTSRPDLWTEGDEKWFKKIKIDDFGCWEMPKYDDQIKPDRARYPQPYVYSHEHGDMRHQMGAAWVWDRVVGPLPEDKLPDGKRAFWPDHRCNNKACVYPRHTVLGRPEANDAFTARMEMLSANELWTSRQWARPSFAYPDGLDEIVHESEVQVLSDRAVILPVNMSKKEFDACVSRLANAPKLPSGGWTTDPGYHVLYSAIQKGLDFDDQTGCWNARIDLDTIPPHKKTIVHACGNQTCCNIRHMDIPADHRKDFQLQPESYVTLEDGRIVNIDSGEILPSYWGSWMLYWNWLRAESHTGTEECDELAIDGKVFLLSKSDFSHIWVHPLTGCWESEQFYPRWTASGGQQNSYGFHHKLYEKIGKTTHRYLLNKYRELMGLPMVLDQKIEADHRCDNKRCCNPLHLEFLVKAEHNKVTRERARRPKDEIAVYVGRLTRLRWQKRA